MLIDTNVAIHIRDGDVAILTRLHASRTFASISLVTLIELEGGIANDPSGTGFRRRGTDRLLRRTGLIGLDRAVVEAYAGIVRHTGFSRRRILDRLIAATAIVHDLTLITIDAADFRDIPDLRLDVWPVPPQ